MLVAYGLKGRDDHIASIDISEKLEDHWMVTFFCILFCNIGFSIINTILIFQNYECIDIVFFYENISFKL